MASTLSVYTYNSGIVLKVADRWLCLGISTVAMGVLYAATPWCTNVIVLISVKGLTGVCSGFYDAGK